MQCQLVWQFSRVPLEMQCYAQLLVHERYCHRTLQYSDIQTALNVGARRAGIAS